jgi:thioredoxin-like negative regulator of GroEL
MPNYSVAAPEAIATRKANPYSKWDQRGPSSRVEPIAMPALDPGGLELRKGEKVFTIGSCFARNVETELLKLGFDVPVRRVLHDLGLGSEVINNYGTPSIYNEMAWALDPEATFSYEDNLAEILPGKFADIHMPPSLRPEPRDAVIKRREVLREMYKAIPECRVVVITLGLIETWFDTRSGLYVNTSPRPTMVKNEPDRFHLHVLSYQEAKDYLDRTIALLNKYGHPEVQILLSVSPVPLSETHRPMDVMIANCESKAILRAVAGAVTAENDNVHYYPSFESVTISDRKIAWLDDLVHVSADIVALNIGRMIETYVKGDHEAATDPVSAAYLAKKMNEGDLELARKFFEENNDRFLDSHPYALEYATFLLASDKFEDALRTLESIPSDFEITASAMLRARALLGLKRAGDSASGLYSTLSKYNTKSRQAWLLAIEAFAAAGDVRGARAAVDGMTQLMFRQSNMAYLAMARGFKKTNPEAAAEAFIGAVRASNRSASYFLEAATHLRSAGRWAEAREVLERFEPYDERSEERLRDLRMLLAG